METIYTNIVLTLIIGMIIGSNSNTLKVSLLKTFSKFSRLPLRQQNTISHLARPVKIKSENRYFDELEIRLLKAILTSEEKGLDISNLNTLLNLKKLSEENQRQRRHLFIKELNLKLFLIFGIREGITRVEFESDKRMKKYALDEKFDIVQLENIINAE